MIKGPPGLTVSCAVHDLPQLNICLGDCDYCLLSPVFDSISKIGHLSAFDPTDLPSALATSRHPVYALGGVTPQRLAWLREVGFAGAALLGSVWGGEDPVAAFKEALAASLE